MGAHQRAKVVQELPPPVPKHVDYSPTSSRWWGHIRPVRMEKLSLCFLKFISIYDRYQSRSQSFEHSNPKKIIYALSKNFPNLKLLTQISALPDSIWYQSNLLVFLVYIRPNMGLQQTSRNAVSQVGAWINAEAAKYTAVAMATPVTRSRNLLSPWNKSQGKNLGNFGGIGMVSRKSRSSRFQSFLESFPLQKERHLERFGEGIFTSIFLPPSTRSENPDAPNLPPEWLCVGAKTKGSNGCNASLDDALEAANGSTGNSRAAMAVHYLCRATKNRCCSWTSNISTCASPDRNVFLPTKKALGLVLVSACQT